MKRVYEETDFINKKLIEPEQMFEVTIKELRFRWLLSLTILI